MSNVETLPIAQPRGVVVAMADKFGMRSDAFEQTLRATVFPANGTREQFAAFLLVAKQYDLNPITKELYAFPAKGGGIVPIVSIDGWLKLINSHPQFDGMEFKDNHDDKGELVSVTCHLWRKDRTKPIVVTEYLAECFRPTEPWKMKHRMLRHKALIQTARYAFGFAGIYDPDEGERIVIAQGGDISQATPPRAPPTPPAPPAPPTVAIQPPAPKSPPVPPQAPQSAPERIDLDELRTVLKTADSRDHLNAAFDAWIVPREKHMSADEIDEADALLREIAAPFWEDDGQ
jgi:phage recombination protein Bet